MKVRLTKRTPSIIIIMIQRYHQCSFILLHNNLRFLSKYKLLIPKVTLYFNSLLNYKKFLYFWKLNFAFKLLKLFCSILKNNFKNFTVTCSLGYRTLKRFQSLMKLYNSS